MAMIPDMQVKLIDLEKNAVIPMDDSYWRRLYAGMAMQGLASMDLDERETAVISVRLADALLAALKEKEATNG